MDLLIPVCKQRNKIAPQQKFAALVARVERLRAVQRESLRQSEHLFQSLLHHAFTVGI
jgi:hypothetical protein